MPENPGTKEEFQFRSREKEPFSDNDMETRQQFIKLARKYGFPLRVVAEDYFGYDWVKYVYSVTVEKIEHPNP